jgi:hypothetical protein
MKMAKIDLGRTQENLRFQLRTYLAVTVNSAPISKFFSRHAPV